ncbi:MAG: alpha-ribazole phosphatase [Chloroflexota bacterium]
MSRLFLVRHGNTKLNSAERFWGHTDVELSPEGLWQAEMLRKRLAEEKIDCIYSSNLRRARVTAETIASGHNAAITVCEDLREINFGEVEGLTYREISERFPEFARTLQDWTARPRFPGGKSHDELDRRVVKFLPRLQDHASEEKVLIVAHAGVLRMLICHLLKVPVRHWHQFHLNLGSLSIMDRYPQGTILNLLNDTSHLKNED